MADMSSSGIDVLIFLWGLIQPAMCDYGDYEVSDTRIYKVVRQAPVFVLFLTCSQAKHKLN